MKLLLIKLLIRSKKKREQKVKELVEIKETVLRQKKRRNRKYVCGFITLTILGAIGAAVVVAFDK